jgi:hypothetical protein
MMERRREGKKKGRERSSKSLELLSHGRFDGGSCPSPFNEAFIYAIRKKKKKKRKKKKKKKRDIRNA